MNTRTVFFMAGALALCAGPVRAAGEAAWLTAGVLGGSTFVDARLADYQWDVAPRAAWGAQVLAGGRRVAAGVRAWRSSTVQTLQLPAGDMAPAVRASTLELVLRGRVTTVAGTGVWAGVSAGRRVIDYRPDRVVVATGPGGDVVADLSPVSKWTAGAGVAFTHSLGSRLQAGLSLDRNVFALDTAHSSGGSVVNRHESFGDWSTRLELAWRIPLTVKGISR